MKKLKCVYCDAAIKNGDNIFLVELDGNKIASPTCSYTCAELAISAKYDELVEKGKTVLKGDIKHEKFIAK